MNPRIAREKRTVEAMIRMYCRDRHRSGKVLCTECGSLLNYALQRLDYCPQKDRKPTCAKCEIHCYRPDMRERVAVVMQYAGPRMMGRHPFLALRHMLDGCTSPRGGPERKPGISRGSEALDSNGKN